MRRSLSVFTLFASAALMGCEDGPNQTFSPAPANAGGLWQEGAGNYGEKTSKDFGNVGGVANKNELCDPQKKHQVWAAMVNQPIYPPSIAGVNILGGDAKTTNYNGMTIDKAESVLCQSTPIGAEYTDNNPYNCWGDNCEVTLGYSATTRKALQVEAHRGYKGTLDFKSRDGSHTYKISADAQPMLRDGAPIPVDWKDGDASHPNSLFHVLNELYDGMIATFAPTLPSPPATAGTANLPDCYAAASCRYADFDDGGGYLVFSTIGVLFRVSSTVAPQPTPSIPERIFIRPVKLMGYSFADVLLKFDSGGEGPVGTGTKVLGTNKTCQVKMGQTFGDFKANCVAVFDPGDKTTDGMSKNDIEMTKLYGGITHNDERFYFQIPGLNSNFSDKGLADDDIVRDNDRPSDDDVATTFNLSSSTLGKLANDYTANDVSKAKDYHGIGLVTLQWAREMQKWFQDYKYGTDPTNPNRKTIGDARCLTATPADGCTGLEGVVTSAPVASIAGHPEAAALANNALGQPAGAKFSGIRTGLKPGTWRSYFCADANGSLATGYKSCVGAGAFDSYFATAYNQIKKVWGKGDETKIPIEARDVRFVFKNWAFALIKYFQVAADPAAKLADVEKGVVDPDNLFFDAIGSGQYEFAEIVDRHLVNTTKQDPIDLVISADILHGIVSNYDFSRDLYRGEHAIYTTMLEDPKDVPGFENNALLMNMFGNPVVASLYHDVKGGLSGWECAWKNTDGSLDAQCDGQQVLTDSKGNILYNDDHEPILKRYKGAFASSETPFKVGIHTYNKESWGSKIKISEIKPFIRAAMVQMPLLKDPYHQVVLDANGMPQAGEARDPAAPMGKWLIPFQPKNQGIGFHIGVNGTSDKFIATSEIDFSGTTISANVDFNYFVDPKTHEEDPTKDIIIRAVETQDFLGEIFACQAQSDGTGDILRVRMYSSAQTILQWFSDHPGATDDCDVIFRYSQFGNYLDFITMRANGVRLGINPGAGNGRVIDALIYDTSLN